MVEFAVEFWWNMLLTIFPAKEARESSSKLRRKFASSFAETFANFTLEVTGAYQSRTEGKHLTFFHADFGKEFPSRTLWRAPS